MNNKSEFLPRMTTDDPNSIMTTMFNLVYGKDGWQYIRYGERSMLTTDFCLKFCEERGCEAAREVKDPEEADVLLCECAFEGCAIATMYVALTGFGHVRERLKQYEDAGIMMPREVKAMDKHG